MKEQEAESHDKERAREEDDSPLWISVADLTKTPSPPLSFQANLGHEA